MTTFTYQKTSYKTECSKIQHLIDFATHNINPLRAYLSTQLHFMGAALGSSVNFAFIYRLLE